MGFDGSPVGWVETLRTDTHRSEDKFKTWLADGVYPGPCRRTGLTDGREDSVCTNVIGIANDAVPVRHRILQTGCSASLW